MGVIADLEPLDTLDNTSDDPKQRAPLVLEGNDPGFSGNRIVGSAPRSLHCGERSAHGRTLRADDD